MSNNGYRPKFVAVVFYNGLGDIVQHDMKTYTYMTDIRDIQVGDKLVVEVSQDLKVVTVVQTEGLTPAMRNKAHAWVVAKVDVQGHIDRVQRMQKAQEIRNILRERKEQVEESLIYQHLAQTDPEIGKLMQELHDLDPSFALPCSKEENNG